MRIERIQEALRTSLLDGWLFFDHHRRDPLAYEILSLSGRGMATRRWYYLIPSHGEPRKLVHRIESGALEGIPGQSQFYSSWNEQQAKLGHLLAGCTRIAMQYSPRCDIPYISLVDGGTLELIRSYGVEVVSSADLVQQFQARWTEAQLESHLRAAKHVDETRAEAFEYIGEEIRTCGAVTELAVAQFITRRFEERGLTADHGPIVAVNANASDPHYEPNREHFSPIRSGDLVLIDMFAKLKELDAVYYDITWTGFCGGPAPDEVCRVFQVVKGARQTASQFVIESVAAGQELAGYQVDDSARQFIAQHGYAEFFFHRTGHSIGTEVHGTGANMDNFESHDERRIISGTCFSIEPGIYLPSFGIRSEVNVYVGDGWARVTGDEQAKLVEIRC